MTVFKAKIELTVLANDCTQKWLEARLKNIELVDLAHQLEDGEYIGGHTLVSVEVVPEDKVRDELVAIGNDGDYFSGI